MPMLYYNYYMHTPIKIRVREQDGKNSNGYGH